LITTVLLPFAVQFNHSFQKHEHSFCKAENIIHFDTPKIDCSFFHFKINTHKIDFSSEIHLAEKLNNEEKILSVETQISSVKIQYKSSRAPPFLLI
jgi:alpha-D-ribose 1-methylphosphonate 5-triphosphate synthase subunit PhnI